MMLRCGSQSCVRNGDKAGQRCEENAAKRVKFLLNTFLVVCAESSLLVYVFHWYVSLF